MGSEKEQRPEAHLPEEGEGAKPWRVDGSKDSQITPREDHGQESLLAGLHGTHPPKTRQKVTAQAGGPRDPMLFSSPETDEKLFICAQCGKTFNNTSNLEPAPYICCECGKSFSNSSSFGVHHRTHTGERPYECTECGRTFSDISNFGAHQRTHRGEKPYRCTLCGKHFSRSSNLIRHQKTHLGEQDEKDFS